MVRDLPPSSLILLGLVLVLMPLLLVPPSEANFLTQAVVKKFGSWASGPQGHYSSLLDWNSYMRLYNKKYSSITQELLRQKIFIARVMEVFLTGVKYRLYQMSYYAAINKYSDLTRDEARRLTSGASTTDSEPLLDDKEAREQLLDALALSNSSAARDTIELDLKRERSLALKRMKRRRRKRSVSDGGGQRDLKMDDLIRVPKRDEADDRRIEWVPPLQNPDYERPRQVNAIPSADESPADDISQDEIAQIERDLEEYDEIPAPVSLLQSARNGIASLFGSRVGGAGSAPEVKRPEVANWSPSSLEDDEEEEDEDDDFVVLRDWRQTGCISPVVDQGHCASCYAISAMSFVEWAYCMKRDRVLTPLSAQYMVSCGVQFMEETDGRMEFYGCNTGTPKQTMYFVRDYGVELEANMPYVAQDTICPVPMNTPLRKKGYLRPNVLKPPIRLSGGTSQLDLALKNGPVMVTMKYPAALLAYGGGVVESCVDEGSHAMLVVGSVIENGSEYLLIKNSLGPDWGLDGYFKLKRSAARECVKEFVVPVISFPNVKTQQRQIKAYLARRQSDTQQSISDELPSTSLLFT